MYSATKVALCGHEEEVKSELFATLASAVIKLRQLLTTINAIADGPLSDISTEPYLGFTVVGGRWSLHIAIGNGNRAGDPVYMLGPVLQCDYHENSIVGVFRLLRLQERIKDWVKATFWPWYCQTILNPVREHGPSLVGRLDEEEDSDDDDE